MRHSPNYKTCRGNPWNRGWRLAPSVNFAPEQTGAAAMCWMQWLTAATFVSLAAAMAQAQTMPPPPSEANPPPASAAPPQAGVASGAVNANVNLRRGPGTNYTVITLIPAGAGVGIGDCNGGWCQVTYQGQDGYVIATSLGQGGPPGPQPAGAGP